MKRAVLALAIVVASVLWLSSGPDEGRPAAPAAPVVAEASLRLETIPCPHPRPGIGMAGERAPESPLSIVLSSATTAVTWGLPVALFRQLRALLPEEGWSAVFSSPIL